MWHPELPETLGLRPGGDPGGPGKSKSPKISRTHTCLNESETWGWVMETSFWCHCPSLRSITLDDLFARQVRFFLRTLMVRVSFSPVPECVDADCCNHSFSTHPRNQEHGYSSYYFFPFLFYIFIYIYKVFSLDVKHLSIHFKNWMFGRSSTRTYLIWKRTTLNIVKINTNYKEVYMSSCLLLISKFLAIEMASKILIYAYLTDQIYRWPLFTRWW